MRQRRGKVTAINKKKLKIKGKSYEKDSKPEAAKKRGSRKATEN